MRCEAFQALHCKEEVRSMNGVRSENIEFKSVSFRADIDLKKNLKQQKIRRSRNKPHSMPMTEKEIDEKLTEHFAQNPILTRREFQFLCLQVKPTACRILRKLVEEGKLKNISTARNPVYVPDNGHYASVAGEWCWWQESCHPIFADTLGVIGVVAGVYGDWGKLWKRAKTKMY